jgi:hypothetical protein
MSQPSHIKNYIAEATINGYRIVKHGTSDGQALQAASVTDALMGISNRLGADAANNRVDVVKAGIAELEFGGNVTRGDPVTTNADGKGVKAIPGATVQTAIAGGAAGDHTVTGIATTDTLVSVLQIDATDASETVADLTAEFSISKADTISNTGGTATTGSFLLVTYRHPKTRIIGYAEVSAVSGDIADCFIAPGEI